MRKLSVVIPAYNEGSRIGPTLIDIVDSLAGKIDYEIIVVNDGSIDDTEKVVSNLKYKIPNLTLINNPVNKGKGFVVKQGMLTAEGDVRLFMDADNSTRVKEIFKMLPYFEEGADVVVGSRHTAGSVIAKKQPFMRVFLGSVLRLIIRTILTVGVKDPQCGFKAFTAVAAREVFPEQSIFHWLFDTEILVLAHQNKLSIKEVPVTWTNESGSHIKFSSMVGMLWDLLKIRLKGSLWPLALAGVAGLLLLLPTVLSIRSTANFQGIYPLLSNDEEHYLAMVREVYDGHGSVSNAYLKEYKDGPYTQPPLGAAYYAGFAKLFGITVQKAGAVNDFLLTFVCVLLLYNLFYLVTESKKISLLLSALFFIFFASALNRPVNPELSFIFLLLGLWLAIKITTERVSLKKALWNNFFLAIIFGILVYIYPFYWMTIIVVYFLLTLYCIFSEKEYVYYLKNWLFFLIPALIWSVGFFFNFASLSGSSGFLESNLRNGFLNTHIPGAFTHIAMLVSCLPISYLIYQLSKNKKDTFFTLALILGGIILNWQNVITGKTLQFPPHFYPIVILFMFLIGGVGLKYIDFKKLSHKSIVLFTLLIILGAGIFYKQKGDIAYAFNIIISPTNISSMQRFAPVTEWLEKNTPRDSAVYVLGEDLNTLIPIYTHNNIYYISSANIFLVSDEELENRWVIQNFFNDIERKDVYGNRDIWPNRFIDAYQNKESRRKILEFITRKEYPETVLMDEKYVNNVLEKHKMFRREGFEKALKTYSADYIALDTHEQNLKEKLKAYKFLDLVTEIEGVIIYKVK